MVSDGITFLKIFYVNPAMDYSRLFIARAAPRSMTDKYVFAGGYH